MKLHLIRHAKASGHSISGNDFDRELSEKGIRQATALGEFLKNEIGSCTVSCSNAARTRQTLDIIGKQNEFSDIKFYNELYLCSKETYLEHLWQYSGNNDLVIVGHNFGISEVASYLTNEIIEMRTSEYVCILFEDMTWRETSKGMGTKINQYRP